MPNGRVVAINISSKKGTPKEPIGKGRLIEGFGLEDDAHAGKGYRQVSLFALESIDKMKALGTEGLCTNRFTENITTEGIELHHLAVGTKIRVGNQAVLELYQIGKECHLGCALLKQAGQCVMPAECIFAKVVKGGVIKPGDVITVL
jgi:MOSC domain-containing protein YiiM